MDEGSEKVTYEQCMEIFNSTMLWKKDKKGERGDSKAADGGVDKAAEKQTKKKKGKKRKEKDSDMRALSRTSFLEVFNIGIDMLHGILRGKGAPLLCFSCFVFAPYLNYRNGTWVHRQCRSCMILESFHDYSVFDDVITAIRISPIRMSNSEIDALTQIINLLYRETSSHC